MRCHNHPERDAIDVCTVCGEVICADCSILINNKVACKACIEQEVHQLTGTARPITIKVPYNVPKSRDIDVMTYPDIATGMLITLFLIFGTLFICLDTKLNPYTPYMALLAIFALIVIVYDINRVMNKI